MVTMTDDIAMGNDGTKDRLRIERKLEKLSTEAKISLVAFVPTSFSLSLVSLSTFPTFQSNRH